MLKRKTLSHPYLFLVLVRSSHLGHNPDLFVLPPRNSSEESESFIGFPHDLAGDVAVSRAPGHPTACQWLRCLLLTLIVAF